MVATQLEMVQYPQKIIGGHFPELQSGVAPSEAETYFMDGSTRQTRVLTCSELGAGWVEAR